MSKSIEQLIVALKKEYEIYEKYLRLAQRKKEVIIKGDVKELDNIIKKEQDMILTMGKIDEIRIAIIGNILFEKKIDWIENITTLANHLEEPQKRELLDLKDQLGNLLNEIKNINDFNNKLVKQSLDYIDFNINLLTNVELKDNTYGSKANEQGLKHRTNMFDAKI